MLLLGGLGITCAVALFGGGFEREERLAFAVCAALLLGAVAASPRARQALADVAGAPAIVGLIALGGVTVVSTAWTLAETEDALVWGMSILGYAIVAVGAAVHARLEGPAPTAGLLALLALAAGGAGLVAVGVGEQPYAERLGGSWRPGGPFEYPPALAFAQIMALPVWLAAACARRSGVQGTALQGAGALGLAVAGTTLGLADSRTALGLAAAAGVVIALRPPGRAGLPELGSAVVVIVTCAGAAHALVGGRVDGPDRGTAELLQLVAVLGFGTLLWAPLRALSGRLRSAGGGHVRRPRLSRRAGILLASGAALVCVAAIAAVADTPEGPGIEKASGFAHGREVQWGAALEVFAREPLVGAGAESYLEASRSDQGNRPIRYAHSLPLEVAAELGVLGLAALGLVLGGVALVWWRRRGSEAFALVGVAVAALPLANLVDWSWHLAGLGAMWALALGALIGARE